MSSKIPFELIGVGELGSTWQNKNLYCVKIIIKLNLII
jgi:hypothetical protein